MDITNTMCRLSELSQWEIDSLVDNMPSGQFDFKCAESYIGVTRDGSWGTWGGIYNPTIVTYTKMMQLLGKTMEFTKSDLIKLAQSKNLFVRQRDGVYKAVLNNIICGESGFTDLSSIKENLTSSKFTNNLDIMDVYETCEYRAMGSYLQGLGLRRIWERTEQTSAQKEMEELLLNIEKGEKAMSVMKEQAKLLQSKL
jgi:hypothetical protein